MKFVPPPASPHPLFRSPPPYPALFTRRSREPPHMFETRRNSAIHLLPLHSPEKAVELPVNLAPNTVFARGRVLGQLSASANEVQTLTVTGGPTGGTVTATVVHPITGPTLTFELPFNANNATAQASARSVLGANDTVSGGPLPGPPISFTFNSDFGSI